jgi:hypothetical protein
LGTIGAIRIDRSFLTVFSRHVVDELFEDLAIMHRRIRDLIDLNQLGVDRPLSVESTS